MKRADSPSCLCRATIHLEGAAFDVTLPTDVSIAEMVPTLCDLAVEHGAGARTAPLARHLCRIDGHPLDAAMTLHELGIDDGAILMMTTTPTEPVHVRHHDSAEAIARSDNAPQWTPTASRAAALATTVGLAGLLGYSAVPGTSATPRLLLGAASAATVAVVGVRSVSATAPFLVPVSLLGGLTATAALPATMLDLPVDRAGVLLAALAVLLLGAAGRIAVSVSGLPPADLLNRLVGGSAAAAGTGTALAASGDAGWSVCALAATVSAALLTRAVSHHEPTSRAILIACGILASSALFVVLRSLDALPRPWLLGVGLLAIGATLMLGFGSPSAPPSPAFIHCTAACQKLALTATLPAAIWALDGYGAAAGWAPL